jgi:hypothetical protein
MNTYNRFSMPTPAEEESLAWSEEHARPQVHFAHGDDSAVEALPPLPWYQRPIVLFGAALCAVLLAGLGLTATWNTGGVATAPAGTTGTTTPSVASPLEGPSPAPVMAPPATATVVVQQQAPTAPRRQQAPAPPVAAPAAPPPAPVVTSPPTTTSTSHAPEPGQCTPPNCITVPSCAPPHCIIDPAPDTSGSGSVCGSNVPADSCAVDPVIEVPGGTKPGTREGGTTPGTAGGTSGANGSIPRCDDLPPDTLC